MKKKLLILHPYLAPYRIDVYNRLAELYDLRVLVYGSPAEKATLGFDLNKVEQMANFQIIIPDGGFYLGRHLVSSIYCTVIQSFRPDIVLCHELGINTLSMIWQKKHHKFRLLATFDDSPLMAKNYTHTRELLRRFILKRIDGAIVVHPEVRDYLSQKYSRFKSRHLYFPIIQDDRLLADEIKSSARLAEVYIKKYRLVGKKIALFVGRQIPIKRPDLLVRIFAELNEPDWVLVLVGNGELEDSIKNTICQHNLTETIIQTGRLSGQDLYAWYYLANLFILPSTFEPFGAVINEALVAGCRVLVSDAAGSTSLVTNTNGTVFNSASEADFRDKLHQEMRQIIVPKQHHSNMPQAFSDYMDDLDRYIRK